MSEVEQGQEYVEMIPYLQIRPNLLLYYQLPEHNHFRRKLSNLLNGKGASQAEGTNISNLKEAKTYNGKMTVGSIKRLRKAINTLCAIAEWKEAVNYKTNKYFKFKLNFITLTLPCEQGEVTDKQIKREVLDVWFKAAKRRFGLKSYIWKAEKQGNGNIHFHITTDCFIPFDQLRDTWNARLERVGFITKFESKHGHRNPNSTDVHATYKVRNLANYLVKYMTKEGKEGDTIEGKVWDCSENLKIKDRCEMVVDSEVFEWMENVRSKYPEQHKKMDQCSLLWLKDEQFKKEITGEFLKLYNDWKERVRSYVKVKPERKIKERKGIDRSPVKLKEAQLRFNLKIDYSNSDRQWGPIKISDTEKVRLPKKFGGTLPP